MGGVLVELTSGATAHVVVGIGLNVSLSADSRREIEADGTRVAAVTEAAATTVSRNALAAVLVEEVLSMLQSFERRGFAAFRDEWQSLDALAGRPARVLRGDDAIEGVARGVDGDGALLLDSGGRLQKFVSGEVSLRGR
jgi:BirA family biotin operon repressor/biotin-[acetyl-CoA-carboxylase] ligase